MTALAFKRHCDGFFDRAICWKTGGPFCHVELVLEGPLYHALCFSSRAPHGTGFAYLNLVDQSIWDVVILSLTVEQEAQLLAFVNGCGTKEYDWLGILGFVLQWGEHDDKDRFCSEICTEALQKVLGYFPGVKPWMTSPMDLYRLVVATT